MSTVEEAGDGEASHVLQHRMMTKAPVLYFPDNNSIDNLKIRVSGVPFFFVGICVVPIDCAIYVSSFLLHSLNMQIIIRRTKGQDGHQKAKAKNAG